MTKGARAFTLDPRRRAVPGLAPEDLLLEKLSDAHHRLRVRHFAAVDPAEISVHEVARHFPLELLVASALRVRRSEENREIIHSERKLERPPRKISRQRAHFCTAV